MLHLRIIRSKARMLCMDHDELIRNGPVLAAHGRDFAGNAKPKGVPYRIRNEFGTVVQRIFLTGNPAIVSPVLLAAQTKPRTRLIDEVAPIQWARRAPPSAKQHR